MVHQVLNSATLHVIWGIWIERNQQCFADVKRSMESVFNVILSEVHLISRLILSKGLLTWLITMFLNSLIFFLRSKGSALIRW